MMCNILSVEKVINSLQSVHVTDVILHPAADLPPCDNLKEKAALSIHSALLEMMLMAQTACEIQEAQRTAFH